MAEGPGTILGGLPVVAVVIGGKDADTPNGPGEYWSEVTSIHWMKRDGSKGKEIPEHIRDRAAAYDYAFCDLTEQVWDHLRHEQWLEEQAAQGIEAATAGETRSGSIEGESPVPEACAPTPPSNNIGEGK